MRFVADFEQQVIIDQSLNSTADQELSALQYRT
jgi:hypothetical protein